MKDDTLLASLQPCPPTRTVRRVNASGRDGLEEQHM
jgi:hypothetical protein